MKTVELIAAESQNVEQDARARRILQDNGSLARRLMSLTESSQQGSSVRDDQDARMRRALAQAMDREANINNDLRTFSELMLRERCPKG